MITIPIFRLKLQKRFWSTSGSSFFNLIFRDSKETYRFNIGFIGLNDLPEDSQKAIDFTIIGYLKYSFF